MADLLTDFANSRRNRSTGYQQQFGGRLKTNEHHGAKPYDYINGKIELTLLSDKEKKLLEEYTNRRNKCLD